MTLRHSPSPPRFTGTVFAAVLCTIIGAAARDPWVTLFSAGAVAILLFGGRRG